MRLNLLRLAKYTEKDLENMSRVELNALISKKLAEKEQAMSKRPMFPLPKTHYSIWKSWGVIIFIGAVLLFWAKKDVKNYRKDTMKMREEMVQEILAKRAAEREANVKKLMAVSVTDLKTE